MDSSRPVGRLQGRDLLRRSHAKLPPEPLQYSKEHSNHGDRTTAIVGRRGSLPKGAGSC